MDGRVVDIWSTSGTRKLLCSSVRERKGVAGRVRGGPFFEVRHRASSPSFIAVSKDPLLGLHD